MYRILVRFTVIGVACTLMLMAVPVSAQPQGTPFIFLTTDPDHPDDPDEKLIVWNNLPGATHYQVVRGDLTILRESEGDFTQATDECVEAEAPTTSVRAHDNPDSGQGFWYVVRGVSAFGDGTFDSLSASQQGERDVEINASDESCEG